MNECLYLTFSNDFLTVVSVVTPGQDSLFPRHQMFSLHDRESLSCRVSLCHWRLILMSGWLSVNVVVSAMMMMMMMMMSHDVLVISHGNRRVFCKSCLLHHFALFFLRSPLSLQALSAPHNINKIILQYQPLNSSLTL